MNGIVTKCIGGLYTVETPDGTYDIKARGVFRNKGISPCVGDNVRIENGVISEIMPRRNVIVRPPIANLDCLIFVVSACQPSPNFLLLDKFIAIAEYKGITPVIAVTKTDIADCSQLSQIYGKIGVRLIEVDYSDKRTVDEVRSVLHNKTSAFTGNSGVGKSTLLNAIDPTLNLATGEISKKLGRGRHTTRHASLYKLSCGGYIADTPGFSTFETAQYDIIRKEELAGCFREFSEFTADCRFKDCSHTGEKGCGILEAVKNGGISQMRHQSYCIMYDEAKLIKEWELK